MAIGILSKLIITPVLASLFIVFNKALKLKYAKHIGLVSTVLSLYYSFVLYNNFNFDTHHFQFIEQANWVDALRIKYSLGVDGIALPLVILQL